MYIHQYRDTGNIKTSLKNTINLQNSELKEVYEMIEIELKTVIVRKHDK